jgi:hypothetical protein
LSRLSLNVVKRTFDMRLGVHLASIDVADRFQPYGEHYSCLIATPAIDGARRGDQLHRRRLPDVRSQSPFFDKNDHTVDIHDRASARRCAQSCHSDTIDRVCDAGARWHRFDLGVATSGTRAAAAAAAASAAAAATQTDATLEQLAQLRLVVAVNASMQGVSVLLHQERQALAKLGVRQLAVKLTSSAAGAIDIVGTLKRYSSTICCRRW